MNKTEGRELTSTLGRINAKSFAQELAKRHADCNFRARSLLSLKIIQRISVAVHRSHAVTTIAKTSYLPAPATSGHQEGKVSWVACTDQKQTTFTKDDLTN